MAGDPWSVDLHSHTLYSDGTLTPTELVRLARSNGVRALAVTDHDHTGGLDEALRVGEATGLEIIPGIELSISFAEFEDIHLLAYYFDWHDARFQARLEDFRIARDGRAERILERINTKLVEESRQPIAYDRVKARVQGAFGRPHIAAALLEHGYVPDMNTAFKNYLIPCNVPKYFMPADEALALVHRARGISVVAHPRFITTDRSRLRQVIEELRNFGLDGIEAYHGDHYPEERQYFTRLANQHGMIVTGGSDYHGFKAPNGQQDSGGKLGSLQLPYGMAVRLRRVHLKSYPLIFLLLKWPAAAAASLRRALETNYQLASGKHLDATPAKPKDSSATADSASLVVDLPAADAGQIAAVIHAANGRGKRTIGIPWEGGSGEAREGLVVTKAVTSERFRRTALERLAHTMVHEAILAQARESV